VSQAVGPPQEAPASTSRVAEHIHRLGPLAVLLLGLYAAVTAWDLGPGSLTRPGPGLWPLLVSLVIMATAAVLLVVDHPSQYESWGRGSIRIAGGLVSLGVFIVLFENFGFFLPALAMLLIWLRFMGGETWAWTLPLALIGPVVMYLIFVEALAVPFPDDLLISRIRG
jgi:putative tricarboxylic transport membrane protein